MSVTTTARPAPRPQTNEASTRCLLAPAPNRALKGWRCEHVVTGFRPLTIMQLRGPSGMPSLSWVLGTDMQLNGPLDTMKPHERQRIMDILAPALQAAFRSLIHDPLPELDAATASLFVLDPWLRHGIFQACIDIGTLAPELCLENRIEDGLEVTTHAGQVVALDRAALLAHLREDLQDSIAGSCDGRLRRPGIVAGSTELVAAQGALCHREGAFAYRFHNPAVGLVSYMIAGYENFHGYAIYVPAAGKLFVLEGRAIVGALACTHLARWLLECFALFGDLMPGYLAAGACGFDSVMDAPPKLHIGHHLWNELSGIDRLLQQLDRLPDLRWLVADGLGSTEMYGPIDTLFPRLAGRVVRSFDTMQAAVRDTLQRCRLTVRVTGGFVSDDLSHRLMAHARTIASARISADLDACQRADIVVVLGLRVENRTHVELRRFFCRLVLAILEIWPGAVFIVDGHNIQDGGASYRSYNNDDAVRTPISEEIRVLDEIQDIFGKTRIVSAVGLPLADNLTLLDAAHCFVSPWGAGLAKYRWTARKPGYVFTSVANLQTRGDLRIYDHPATMTPGVDMRWVNAIDVVDLPDAPCVVPHHGNPKSMSFTMQDHVVIDEILSLFRYMFPPATASAPV